MSPAAQPSSRSLASAAEVPCCPQLASEDRCDVLDFHYRLEHRARVGNQVVPVEVKIHARLERCSGPLILGDLVYSTTLLPGEQVRLFSSDRRSRFTFDKETSIAYRHEQTSEESFYMGTMAHSMQDLSVIDSSQSSASKSGSFSTTASGGGFTLGFVGAGSATVSGNYNASSTRDFLRELSSHAESSSSRTVNAVRSASSVSVGEVQTRTHAEGESESHFEASSRQFSNPNRCHAVTFFFYQINKTQTIRFSIEAIRRRVVDPAGDTAVAVNPPQTKGDIDVIPQAVLATAANRVAVESLGRTSIAADRAGLLSAGEGSAFQPGRSAIASTSALAAAGRLQTAEPLSAEVREAALKQVDADLARAGLIAAAGGELSPEVKKELSFEVRTSLPTGGILVKGCLDDCSVCEPAREREIELELVRKDLENKLLARRIELLEKAQEYRCCPAGEEEDDGDDA